MLKLWVKTAQPPRWPNSLQTIINLSFQTTVNGMGLDQVNAVPGRRPDY